MSLEKKQLSYWRRAGLDHVYAEYKDNEYQPEINPLGSKLGDRHGPRYTSEIIPVHVFEIRHRIKVHEND